MDGSSESIVSTVRDTSIDRTTSNQPDVNSQMRSVECITLRNKQIADPSLSKYWDIAQDNQKNGFYIQDSLLYLLYYGQVNGGKDYCMRCETRQLFAPARRSDLNTIEPIPRDAPLFGHLVFDCIGPFSGL